MTEWNGFSARFVQLIHACISSPRFSILLNGSPFGYFKATRGIRQGDPISPALFTLLLDLLSCMLAKAELDSRITGVKVSRTSPRVTHLMYADDLVIYCHASPLDINEIVAILHEYCHCTGQAINWDKSSVHFSHNVTRAARVQYCRLLGITECTHQSSYLRHRLCKYRHKNDAYHTVMDKLSNKLSGWKAKEPSMASRLVLVKSIAQAIPAFVMKTFYFTKTMLCRKDNCIRDFLWGFDSSHNTHHF